MGKRELVALLCLSSSCLAIIVWLFLTMPLVCLQFVIVEFPDHTHLLFFMAGSEAGMAYNEVAHQQARQKVRHQKTWPIVRHQTSGNG